MTITVIGTGFVGVVSAAVFASQGHQVYGLDIDEKKVEMLNKGKVPFYEPDLEELVAAGNKTKKLHFTTSYKEAVSKSEVIFLAVGTPSAPDGQADLKFVFAAAESLATHLQPNAIVVIKSTVPPGTNKKVEEVIEKNTSTKFHVASMPEFLREGSAVHDTLHPDRVLIGSNDKHVRTVLSELHQPFEAPIFEMSPESAQMSKYSANSYLATRITFINQIADLCEKNGADVMEVVRGIGADKRIGTHYWYPGIGYGGSCFPKDVKELAAYSRSVGEGDNLLNSISHLNEIRVQKLFNNFSEKIGGFEGKKVAVLGVSFKPNTDDTREAPSTKVIPFLLSRQAKVTAYDPMVKPGALKFAEGEYDQKDDIDSAVRDADVVVALVEWPEIVKHQFSQVKGKEKFWFIDIRNQFSPTIVKNWGYEYMGVGR